MSSRSLALALCLLTALPTAHALACSRARCNDSTLFPSSGSIPANMVQLLFTEAQSYLAPDAPGPAPRLYRFDGETKVSVPFRTAAESDRRMWIAPLEPQPVGSRLVLEADPGGCSGNGLHAELTVTDAAAVPTMLGTLVAELARDELTVPVINGSCVGPVDATYADLTVQLSASAAPYAALLRYQLFVDGVRRDGLARPQGQARIFAVCDKAESIEPDESPESVGRHQVRVEASLPDGTSLSTDELEVELRCEGESPADTGDGCALGGRTDGAWALALAMFLLRRRRR